MRTISRQMARRFILRRQGLLGGHVFIGKSGAYDYVRQSGCIQFDPVDVCGRNADLTLQSRVKDYTKSMLDTLLYTDRLLVDYVDKELSIFPTEDWPYFAAHRQAGREHGASFKGVGELCDKAIAYIREHGPVSSDTLPIDGEIFWHSSMHWSGNWHSQSRAARSVLEQLYTEGVVIIHHKSGTRKYYDLADKYIDQSLLNAPDPCKDEAAHAAWVLRRRIGAVGLMWNHRSDVWLGTGLTTEQRQVAFECLERDGGIEKIQVEGIRDPLYYLTSDAPLMDAVLDDQIDTKPRLEFLAPLDPMLWDRRLIQAMWDYHYSWEIYTPAEKRKYGYYVLPMLHGESFIGRIEAAADRESGALVIKNIWLEDGVRQTKKLQAAIDSAVKRLARFNNCHTVERKDTLT